MSRCFPFPPPGYEKMVRTEDMDLLLRKEKQKEKKQKEKRESKEKKEKDTGDGKHKEKKERKVKHQDKKNDGEKEKDREKKSGEKRVAGQTEVYRRDNLSQKEDGNKLKSSTGENKSAGQFGCKNGEKLSQNSRMAEMAKDSKVGRRIHDDNKRTRNQLVENFSTTNWKNGGTVELVVKDVGAWTEGTDVTDEKRVDDRQLDEGGVSYGARSSQKYASVQSLPKTTQNKLEEVPRPMESIANRMNGKEKLKEKEAGRQLDRPGFGYEARSSQINNAVQNVPRTIQNRLEEVPRAGENIDNRTNEKEKIKEKEGDVKKGEKHNAKGREKKSQGNKEERNQGKNNDRDKKKKQGERVKQTGKLKSIDNVKLRDSNKINLSHAQECYPPHHLKAGDSSAAVGLIRKRKEVETNGLCCDNDVQPTKLPRTTSFHRLLENGLKSENSHTSTMSTSNSEGPGSRARVDDKRQRTNGMVEAQLSSTPFSKPCLASTQDDQTAQISVKPPHRDSKYLSQVHSVPEVEEWHGFDDQEWLFSSDKSQSMKPWMEISADDEGQRQVWAEALRIESADVCALPYVIPY